MRHPVVPAAVALAWMAALASAQDKPVTTTRENSETLKLTAGGRVVLDFVYRSSEITAFTQSVGGGSPTTSDSETTFEGYAAVRLDATFKEKFSGVVEFGTKRVDGFQIDEWGNAGAESIKLREARVVAADWLAPGLRLEAGLTTWSFDVRGRGSPFFMDPRHSQPAFRDASDIGTASSRDTGTSLFDNAAFPEELESVGVWAQYTENLVTLDLVALPAVLEGGSPSRDEAIYAADLWYNLPAVGEGSRLGMIVSVINLGDVTDPVSPGLPILFGSPTEIMTIGGGVVLKGLGGVHGLALYAEGYFQRGDAGSLDPDGSAGPLPRQDLEAGGRASSSAWTTSTSPAIRCPSGSGSTTRRSPGTTTPRSPTTRSAASSRTKTSMTCSSSRTCTSGSTSTRTTAQSRSRAA